MAKATRRFQIGPLVIKVAEDVPAIEFVLAMLDSPKIVLFDIPCQKMAPLALPIFCSYLRRKSILPV